MRTEIERVVAVIKRDYGSRLTVAALSRAARLSPFYMSRLFRRELGVPPAAFLAAVRMEEARRMLVDTETSVADISEQVGYASLGAFTSRFTRTFGMPPAQYRRHATETVPSNGGGDIRSGTVPDS